MTDRHEHESLCAALEEIGNQIATAAYQAIDSLHEQRADLLERLAASEARERALRDALYQARHSLLHIVSAATDARTGIERASNANKPTETTHGVMYADTWPE